MVCTSVIVSPRNHRSCNMHTYMHPFGGPFSGTTWVSRYEKGKTSLDFTEARASEWQWHQLAHMQVCTSLQTDDHTKHPTTQFFTGWMPFLPPNQQRQSTEGLLLVKKDEFIMIRRIDHSAVNRLQCYLLLNLSTLLIRIQS